MDRCLKTVLTNKLKSEARYILHHEQDMKLKQANLEVIFDLQKVLETYDDIKPLLNNFFNSKFKEERWYGDEE